LKIPPPPHIAPSVRPAISVKHEDAKPAAARCGAYTYNFRHFRVREAVF